MLVHILVDDLDILPALAATQKSECDTRLARAQTVKAVVEELFLLLLVLHAKRQIEEEGGVLALCGQSLSVCLRFLARCSRLVRRTIGRHLMQCIDLTRNVLVEELAHHRCLAGVAREKDVDLAHISPLECRCHRLKEILNAAADAVLKCALELAHVDVQADLCAIPRIPRLLG